MLETWGSEVLDQSVEVRIDLSENDRGRIHQQMPKVQIVADRFDGMQLMNPQLNTLRNPEIRTLAAPSEEPERTEIAKILKSSQSALLKPKENLTDQQKVILQQVKQVSSTLAHLHQQKEPLRAIFATATDGEDGMTKLASG